MKPMALPSLRKRLRAHDERARDAAAVLGAAVAVWRVRIVGHRFAIALLGAGVAGAALALRWRLVARVAAALVGTALRAAALATVEWACVNRAVAVGLARAGRTPQRP